MLGYTSMDVAVHRAEMDEVACDFCLGTITFMHSKWDADTLSFRTLNRWFNIVSLVVSWRLYLLSSEYIGTWITNLYHGKDTLSYSIHVVKTYGSKCQ